MLTDEQQQQAFAALPPELQGLAASKPAAEAHEAAPADEWVTTATTPRTRETPDGLPEITPLTLEHMPELRPELIEGILRLGHIMMLAAPSKAGKTWALIELSVAIATGGLWLGHKCSIGRVLYVDGETDTTSLLHRFRAVADSLGVRGSDVIGRIDVWSLRGKSKPLDQLVPSILDRASTGKYTLVVIDPAYTFMKGDENAAGDVRGFFTAITAISEGIGCSVIFDHHHSKGAKGDASSIDRASGSGMFGRAPDAIVDMIELVPKQEQIDELPESDKGMPAFRVTLTLREFPQIEPFNVWFKWPQHIVDASGILEEWEPMTASRKGGEAKSGKTQLENLGKTALVDNVCSELIEENSGQPIRLCDLVRRLGWTDKTVRKHLANSRHFRLEHPSGNTATVSPLTH